MQCKATVSLHHGRRGAETRRTPRRPEKAEELPLPPQCSVTAKLLRNHLPGGFSESRALRLHTDPQSHLREMKAHTLQDSNISGSQQLCLVTSHLGTPPHQLSPEMSNHTWFIRTMAHFQIAWRKLRHHHRGLKPHLEKVPCVEKSQEVQTSLQDRGAGGVGACEAAGGGQAQGASEPLTSVSGGLSQAAQAVPTQTEQHLMCSEL